MIAGSLIWNTSRVHDDIMNLARAETTANLNKDITFRRWASFHGGVYVPVTEEQRPVPWLANIPERDITTDSGKKLTLLDPATMQKQMMTFYADQFGVKGRITSLDVLNPENKPDEWERQQLFLFEKGQKKEHWEIFDIEGEPYLRHLRVMYMEESCQKCHEHQGYRVGDVRGATGSNIPLAKHYSLIEKSQRNLLVSHSIIWALGCFGVALYGQASVLRKKERASREQDKDNSANALRLYANAFQSGVEATLILDEDSRIINVNRAFLQHTGYSFDEVTGQHWSMLHGKQTKKELYDEMHRVVESDGHWQGEAWGRKKNGEDFPKSLTVSKIYDSGEKSSFYIATYTDITERKKTEARVSHLAHHDSLTKLYNRYAMEECLHKVLVQAKENENKAALLFIDIDRFKSINESLGHQFGDQLLIQFSERLKSAVSEDDILARIGADEFVVALSHISDNFDVTIIAERIMEKVSKSYNLGGRRIDCSVSIGISLFPKDGTDTFELLKNADIAMCQAKSKGRKNYQFFTKLMSDVAHERLKLEHEMRAALYKQEFELYFQPILEADGLSVSSLETLIRWKHSELGFIPPDKFIPIAEETGFILVLGDWILDEACRQFTDIKAQGYSIPKLSINLSVKQLQSKKLLSKIQSVIECYKLEPGELELEITETAAMEDPQFAVSQLNMLSGLDVSLAIDDFGTGYSSLSYLKRLPIQILKLDRSFVDGIGSSISDEEICTATIALAHNLGLQVVAEGVESRGQHEFLKSNLCDYVQGYCFCKPKPVADLCHYLDSKSS